MQIVPVINIFLYQCGLKCKYSAINKRSNLFRFSIVFISKAVLSSAGVCHTGGNGVGIKWRIGTSKK